jgi:hypothetical protein
MRTKSSQSCCERQVIPVQSWHFVCSDILFKKIRVLGEALGPSILFDVHEPRESPAVCDEGVLTIPHCEHLYT